MILYVDWRAITSHRFRFVTDELTGHQHERLQLRPDNLLFVLFVSRTSIPVDLEETWPGSMDPDPDGVMEPGRKLSGTHEKSHWLLHLSCLSWPNRGWRECSS
jgi:hypothetical protein